VFADEEISGGYTGGWTSRTGRDGIRLEQGEEIEEHREVDIGKITDEEEDTGKKE